MNKNRNGVKLKRQWAWINERRSQFWIKKCINESITYGELYWKRYDQKIFTKKKETATWKKQKYQIKIFKIFQQMRIVCVCTESETEKVSCDNRWLFSLSVWLLSLALSLCASLWFDTLKLSIYWIVSSFAAADIRGMAHLATSAGVCKMIIKIFKNISSLKVSKYLMKISQSLLHYLLFFILSLSSFLFLW